MFSWITKKMRQRGGGWLVIVPGFRELVESVFPLGEDMKYFVAIARDRARSMHGRVSHQMTVKNKIPLGRLRDGLLSSPVGRNRWKSTPLSLLARRCRITAPLSESFKFLRFDTAGADPADEMSPQKVGRLLTGGSKSGW